MTALRLSKQTAIFASLVFIVCSLSAGSPVAQKLTFDEVILKQGLMCGTLSSAWPLLDMEGRRAQMNYLGTKKIDNRLLHELRYTPGATSDLKIPLYFDSEPFHHVRTEYERVIPAPMGK